ncbi:MAG: hypothetical protein VYC34_05830, partial [Planctomycetota bacterium]|nr:hypothetical protein [Planctomycetota bacterium]
MSKVREGRPERLKRRLAGDIDNIVLKAMRKEPQRRYVSAEQFAEDIRRHLTGLPVTARPDSVGYRFNKFVRRNRMGVGAAAAVMLALMAGAAGTTWQAVEASRERDAAVAAREEAEAARASAERRFDEVRALGRIFIYDFHDAIETLAGSTPARELLVTTALEYLRNLEKEAAGNPALQEEIAEAYLRVGDVQGGLRGGNVGETDAALESYRAALRIREALGAEGQTEDLRYALYVTQTRIGDALWSLGEAAAALEARRAALAAAVGLGETDRGKGARASAMRELATMLSRTGDLEEAMGLERRGLELLRQIATERPEDLNARRSLSVSLVRMSDFTDRAGDSEEAIRFAREAERIRRDLLMSAPDSGRAQRDLMNVRRELAGLLLKRGETDAALETLEGAVADARRLAELDPTNARAARDLIIVLQERSKARRDAGDEGGAIADLRRSLELLSTAREDDPDAALLARLAMVGHSRLGDM